MRFIADLHIHSKYSLATSRQLDPEHLDLWARRKGITLVGTGDFTHPAWTAELREKLEPAEPGLFALRPERRLDEVLPQGAAAAPLRFVLSAEISTIYKQDGRTRKVHHLILAPDLVTVDRIQHRLGRLGNITSDGRPILGLDSRNLLEIALEASPEILFIPAHVWTPWFSALGHKSGFDRITDCYGDLAGHIHAVETGLSSDPPMNERCSFLDRYTLVSNSDAHSPEKLGREANRLNTELSYPALRRALVTGEGFDGTVEFYPEEGKYHHDGHRKCGVHLTPDQTEAHGGRCPACGRPLTIGVLNRVQQLADRPADTPRPDPHPFHSLIPLKEVLSEILGVGAQSKRVGRAYADLLAHCGSEFDILLDRPLDELAPLAGETLTEAVARMRAGRVQVKAGYDGEFGVIHVFTEAERRSLGRQTQLFPDAPPAPAPPLVTVPSPPRPRATPVPLRPDRAPDPDVGPTEGPLAGLNPRQRAAAEHGEGPALVLAGPGTGKTRVLTCRIAHLIEARGVAPGRILAVTFTRKAAGELRARLHSLLGPDGAHAVTVGTFHALSLAWLREQADFDADVADPEDRAALLETLGIRGREQARVTAAIARARQGLQTPADLDDPGLAATYTAYNRALSEAGLIDLDDLVPRAVERLQHDPGLRRRHDWVLVDEVQDLNAAQYALLRALSPEPTANLFAIGDPRQAIYAFRGADLHHLERFTADWPGVRRYRLTTSYRCPRTILRASAQVVPADGSKLEGLNDGLRIQLSEQPSERAEAEFIARDIERLLGGLRFFSLDSDITDGHDPDRVWGFGDVAVLVRTTAQLPALERACADHGLPCQVVGRAPWHRIAPQAQILEVTRLALRPDRRLLHHRLVRAGVLTETQTRGLRLDPTLPATAALERIVADYLPHVPVEAPGPWRDLRARSTPAGSIEDFVRGLSLGTAEDAEGLVVDRVALMTLHAAKGLEFPAVFIAGCEEGLLPYDLAERRGDVAEEARLLYVGMTRARELLTLTWAQRRSRHGRLEPHRRSRFLDTVEPGLVEQRSASRRRRRPAPDLQLRLFD